MNRRDFIKAGTGAFFIASANRVFGLDAASSRVRLAIVGCHAKGRGFQVMKTALKVPGVEIAWVCDVDRRARENAADHVFSASFKYPGNKLIVFEMTCHGRTRPPFDDQTAAVVYGEKGSLYLGSNDNALLMDAGGKVIKEWTEGGMEKVGTISLTNPTGGMDFEHMKKFVECIRAKDQNTFAPADVGVKSSVLPLLANIAADCGETIRVDPLTGNAVSKAGADKWAREYEKGRELA